MTVVPDINELLKYINPRVLKRYEKDYPDSPLKPEELFEELLKYFWLSHQHQSDKADSPSDESLHFDCIMHAEMQEMDNMWHTFILFTKDYADFCNHYFENFIHHYPILDGDAELPPEEYEMDLYRYLTYIHNQLGEATLRKWFKEDK